MSQQVNKHTKGASRKTKRKPSTGDVQLSPTLDLEVAHLLAEDLWTALDAVKNFLLKSTSASPVDVANGVTTSNHLVSLMNRACSLKPDVCNSSLFQKCHAVLQTVKAVLVGEARRFLDVAVAAARRAMSLTVTRKVRKSLTTAYDHAISNGLEPTDDTAEEASKLVRAMTAQLAKQAETANGLGVGSSDDCENQGGPGARGRADTTDSAVPYWFKELGGIWKSSSVRYHSDTAGGGGGGAAGGGYISSDSDDGHSLAR